jgi:hypothetical protein
MGDSARDEAQWLPSALPLWKLYSCESCKCLEPWLKRQTSTQMGPHDTIRKILKRRCLRHPLIVHLDLICMSYDQKKGAKLEIWFSTPNPLKSMGQMRSNRGVLYIVEKIFLRAIRYCPCIFKTYLICERYEHPKLWDNKSPNFGTPIWESRRKVTFGCSPHGEAQSIL